MRTEPQQQHNVMDRATEVEGRARISFLLLHYSFIVLFLLLRIIFLSLVKHFIFSYNFYNMKVTKLIEVLDYLNKSCEILSTKIYRKKTECMILWSKSKKSNIGNENEVIGDEEVFKY